MGYYINPPHISKEFFLEAEGEPITQEDAASFEFACGDEVDEVLPVVLIDNGAFTAAAIAYNERELAEFTRLADSRPRKWFLVNKVLLNPYMV